MRLLTETMPDDEPTITGSGRIGILDLYKGMAIMGVIITHLVLLQNGTDGHTGDPSAIVQFMFSGLIMFIVISGYFYKPGKSYLGNVRSRVVPLFTIFIVMTILMTVVMYLYLMVLGYDLSQYDLIDTLLASILGKGYAFVDFTSPEFIPYIDVPAPFYVSTQMYYLGVLCFAYLIFFALIDRVIGDWRKLVATIAVLFLITSAYIEFVHLQTPFYIHMVPMFAGFLMVGALLRKLNFAHFLENGLRDKRYWIGLFVAIIFTGLTLILFPADTDITLGKIGDYGIFSVFTFAATSLSCGIMQLFLAAILLRLPIWNSLFQHMGKEVLPLYLYHMLVCKMLIAPFVTLGTDYNIPLPFAEALVMAFVTIAVILVLTYFYRRIMARGSRDPPRPLPVSV